MQGIQQFSIVGKAKKTFFPLPTLGLLAGALKIRLRKEVNKRKTELIHALHVHMG